MPKRMDLPTVLVMMELAKSKSEARRLIEQGAIYINSIRILEPFPAIEPPKTFTLQVGKRKWVNVIIDDN